MVHSFGGGRIPLKESKDLSLLSVPRDWSMEGPRSPSSRPKATGPCYVPTSNLHMANPCSEKKHCPDKHQTGRGCIETIPCQ